MQVKIWALPGFLGLPQDWHGFKTLPLTAFDWQTLAWNSLTEWGSLFNHFIIQQPKKLHILMGYSLGGRLALHALIDQPSQWQAAIIISGHPGLTDALEKHKRCQQDAKWAKRFENEEWQSLMQAWNAQQVFKNDPFIFKRYEWHYQRLILSYTLIVGSLGRQADLKQQIASLPMPILWLTGSQDLAYCQLAQSLSFRHSLSRWQYIDQAGHRLPWTHSDVFSRIVQTFLHDLDENRLIRKK